ncbi:hypothetical protein D9611_001869 [Ephemerocybe angulata]|uniref:F-box domain-containing protein n=1 Tax=Ephemerocybe angulata TaxID=980116 RepID=A0A8H5CJE7_9AGAR|nr:hypothetical protein D9611_001869 [Tulosesus angulatus]
MAHFLELPDDILFVILSSLSPEDLLSVQQTCRGMHVLGSADHVWHALQIDLPLDLQSADSGSGTSSHPAALIRQSTIRALRLDQNWHKPKESRIKLTRIPHTDIVDQIQLVGKEHVLTLSRSGNLATFLTLWRTRVAIFSVARIEIPNASKFSASLEDGKLVVASLSSDHYGKGSLRLYDLALDDAEESCQFEEVFCQSLSEPGNAFFDVHVVGRTAISGIAALNGSICYKLLLVDVDSRKFDYFDMPSEGVQSVRFKLYRDFIFMGAIEGARTLTFLQYDVRAMGPCQAPIPIRKHEVCDLSRDSPLTYEYHISTEPTVHGTKYFPVAVQHTPDSANRRAITIYKIPLLPKRATETVQLGPTLWMTRDSTTDVFCLGETGFRAVWLERWWDADEFHFAKAALGPEGPSNDKRVVQPLWPAHLGLPFEPHACHAIYFEEATGRICFSLHTEEVYLMEF